MRHPAKALALLPLLLLGAGSVVDPEELVRQGNAAFAAQDYEQALQHYAQAEKTTQNPGLVAFNQGTALYRLGRFREAQLHFLRCVDEADAARRPVILYNLGNAILQQATAGNDLALFREAVETLTRCAAQPGIDPDLRLSARHNLELAKLLWLQARIARGNDKEPEPGNTPDPQPPPMPKTPELEKTQDGSDPEPGSNPKPAFEKDNRKTVQEKKDDQKPIPTDERAPGTGKVPPPVDMRDLHAMTPEDATTNLERAAERIRQERAAYRLRAAPVPARGVPDW